VHATPYPLGPRPWAMSGAGEPPLKATDGRPGGDQRSHMYRLDATPLLFTTPHCARTQCLVMSPKRSHLPPRRSTRQPESNSLLPESNLIRDFSPQGYLSTIEWSPLQPRQLSQQTLYLGLPISAFLSANDRAALRADQVCTPTPALCTSRGATPN